LSRSHHSALDVAPPVADNGTADSGTAPSTTAESGTADSGLPKMDTALSGVAARLEAAAEVFGGVTTVSPTMSPSVRSTIGTSSREVPATMASQPPSMPTSISEVADSGA